METGKFLTLPERREKSYVRSHNRTNTIFTFMRYKSAALTFAKKETTFTTMVDTFAKQLLSDGLITQQQLDGYVKAVCDEYYHKDCHPDQSPEEVYDFVCRARYAHFDLDALEQARELAKNRGCHFCPAEGIDQSEKKQQLLKGCKEAIFVLCEAALFSEMEKDVQTALNSGAEVYVCVSPDGHGDLPRKEQLASWLDNDINWLEIQEDLTWEEENTCLFFYGEEGLLHCRQLTVDAVVHAIPTGYHAQAMCNMLAGSRSCVVYIPAGYDITPWVPLAAQTRLTYYHLAKLWKDHGDSIYTLTVPQLYSQYPQYFINIYDDLDTAPMPITVSGHSLEAYDANREAAIGEYLNSFSNISYESAYFDENLTRQPICYDSTQSQPGILAHSIRVKKAKGARVITCQKGVSPRQLFAKENAPGTGLCSNFLFFLTPKVDTLHNHLRSDRVPEQAFAGAGHVDYMLFHEDGKRVETFPLYQKACLAMDENGNFRFFHFRLGGGKIFLDDAPFSWNDSDVDPENEDRPVIVYSPYASLPDEDKEKEAYRKPVGQGRVNLVTMQEKLICIRKGDVLLPCAGVVISLDEATAAPLLNKLKPIGNGYYDVSGLDFRVELEAPAEVPPQEWAKIQWVYGGGMSLIRDGQSLCYGEDMSESLRLEGWTTPLSRQTQESTVHKSVKHPRTAIGITENGEMVLLVYSGRTWRSTGANYREMITIAQALYPDIRELMNVDGGASSVLGLVQDGSFMELSSPATSAGNCVGMVRPINTLFYIPAEKENTL